MDKYLIYENTVISDILFTFINNFVLSTSSNFNIFNIDENDYLTINSKFVKNVKTVCYNELKIIINQIQYLENILNYTNFTILLFNTDNLFFIELSNGDKLYFIKPNCIFPIIDNNIHISSDYFYYPKFFKNIKKSDIYPFSTPTMEIFNNHKDEETFYFTIPINESYHSISVCCIKLLCKNESKKNFKSALLNIQGSPLFYTLYRSLNMERFIYI